MEPYLKDNFGNANSTHHSRGLRARNAVEQARSAIAECLTVAPDRIIFVPTASIANRLIIGAPIRKGEVSRLVTSQIEHPSIMAAAASLEEAGADVSMVPVDSDGIVDVRACEELLSAGGRGLISVMHVNNEIGTIQPTGDLAVLSREFDCVFHSDMSQSLGKVMFSLENIDIATFSMHKAYGPVGAALIVVGDRALPPGLLEILRSGESGTLSVASIVGAAKAVEFATAGLDAEIPRQAKLVDRFWQLICKSFPDALLNGSPEYRIASNCNLYIPGVDADELLGKLFGKVAISTGSACTSGSLAPSHVLLALGLDHKRAANSLRVSVGRPTTECEVDTAALAIAEAIAQE